MYIHCLHYDHWFASALYGTGGIPLLLSKLRGALLSDLGITQGINFLKQCLRDITLKYKPQFVQCIRELPESFTQWYFISRLESEELASQFSDFGRNIPKRWYEEMSLYISCFQVDEWYSRIVWGNGGIPLLLRYIRRTPKQIDQAIELLEQCRNDHGASKATFTVRKLSAQVLMATLEYTYLLTH